MTAETPARRRRTARDAGEQWGYSARHIRRIVAEPREVYLARAQERIHRSVELRATGMSIRAIAAEIGCSPATVHRALKIAAHTTGQASA